VKVLEDFMLSQQFDTDVDPAFGR